MNINALKSLNGAALLAGAVGAIVGFVLAAEQGLAPAADGSEPLTATVIIAFAAAVIGFAGGILAMPKPRLAALLMLIAAGVLPIGVPAAVPAAAILLLGAILAFIASRKAGAA